jgi:hypothetical protein
MDEENKCLSLQQAAGGGSCGKGRKRVFNKQKSKKLHFPPCSREGVMWKRKKEGLKLKQIRARNHISTPAAGAMEIAVKARVTGRKSYKSMFGFGRGELV